MSHGRNKRWIISPEDTPCVDDLQHSLGCPRLVARLLVGRGIRSADDAQAFLAPDYSQLADPLLLPDAERAVERICTALERKERILIHGDYDSDGVTSAALWSRLLTLLGADVRAHVPHRHRDGYDIRSKFVGQACAEGANLIITTDCGIRRLDEVEEARAAGIDVIVTDHHEPGPELPKAVAVVNPQRKDSRYPFRGLSGVGVAFRVGEALVRRLDYSVESYRKAYGDLAAIGTVTDIMPLLGDNRVIVKYGIESLQHTQKPGLRALIASAGIEGRPMTAYSIGYILGPRLNAIGRVDDSRIALNLLLTRDPVEAGRLAAKLEQANNDRRDEEGRILAEALAQVAGKDMAETSCIVLAGDSWHRGVIGIVANRLVERMCRPTVLIAIDAEAGTGRGSARSIRAFDLYAAISECADHLLEFGGHSHAAGFDIAPGEVAAFAAAMDAVASRCLTADDFVPSLDVEAEVAPEDIQLDLVKDMAQFEPWGHDNPEPVLLTRGLDIVEIRRIGKDQTHLRIRVCAPGMDPTDALWWGGAEYAENLHVGDRVDLCHRLQINSYNGRTSVQLQVQDMAPADHGE